MNGNLIVGNWKMNGSLAANQDLVRAVIAGLSGASCKAAVCAPALYLPQLQQLATGSNLLWGAQDFVLPPATMQTMADRLTAAPVETRLLQGVSHYPPLEAPRAVTAAVLSFLERLRAAPATRP